MKIERKSDGLFANTPLDIEGKGLIYSLDLKLTKKEKTKEEKNIMYITISLLLLIELLIFIFLPKESVQLLAATFINIIFSMFNIYFLSKRMDHKNELNGQNENERKDRYKFLIYLTHFIHKKKLSTLDEKEITLYAKKHQQNLLTRGIETYEIKKGNMYYIFSYSFGNNLHNIINGFLQIENNYMDSENRSHNYNKSFDIATVDGLLDWYNWQFENNINFKINTQYDIHKQIEFLDQNKKYFSSEYNHYEGVIEIRKNMNTIKSKLQKLIDEYYTELNKKYDNIVASVKNEMRQFSSAIVQENMTEENLKKDKIQEELKQQQKKFSLLEEEM